MFFRSIHLCSEFKSQWVVNSCCYIIRECFFYFNHFSLIIFYHSVWLGFELFGLSDQVFSQGYGNQHCHNKPQTENGAGVWMMSCPEEIGWEFGRFWKRFSWCPTMVWRSWCLTMVWRSWGPTMVLRSWSLTMRIWGWTMGADSWVSTVGAESRVLCHGV